MAISDSQAQDNNQNQTNQNAKEAQRPDIWNFHTGAMFGAPISRGVGSEYYSKLKLALFEIYKQASNEVEIQLLDLDNVNEPDLVYSAIIVALRNKKSADVGIAFHVLLLEATGVKLQSLFENYNGNQVEIFRVTSDAFDKVLIDSAMNKVRKAFPNERRIFMVDGSVVPESFNPDNKYAVHSLALNAGLAANTELIVQNPNFTDMNLGTRANDNNLVINIAFQAQQIENTVGDPMRSDVMITFNSNRSNQGQRNAQTVNSGDREVLISRLSGFVDLVRVPGNNPNQMYGNYYPQQQGPVQSFAPRLVITNLESNFSLTPASVLLSFATSLSLNEDFNWMQVFRPQPTGRNEIDLKDFGALNIDANVQKEASGFGTRVNTKDTSFKLEDLGQLIHMMVQPALMISLDCPEYGPQSWYLSVFAMASNGNQAAYSSIYRSLDTLTNGNFSRNFTEGQAMFTDTNNRVHLGTWTDRNGNKRDIRDIDHLAVCNLVGDRDPSTIREWSNTFLNLQVPLAQRLATRKKIIAGLTNETAVFSGFAQRLTFTKEFLLAIQKSIMACGTSVQVNTPLNSSAFNEQRGVATFANAALMQPGQQSFTTQGGFRNFQNPAFTGNMGYARW